MDIINIDDKNAQIYFGLLTNQCQSIAFILFMHKIPFFLALFFLCVSCDVSSLSEQPIYEIELIGADVIVTDIAKTPQIDDIEVRLFDKKGKQIKSESINVRVNNVPLPLYVVHELYYTKKIRYKLRDFPFTESLYFDIIMSDSTVIPLAHVKPVANQENFTIPKKWDSSEDIKIHWQAGHELDQIQLWKNYVKYDSTQTSTSLYSEINPGPGQYTIRKNYVSGDEFENRLISL